VIDQMVKVSRSWFIPQEQLGAFQTALTLVMFHSLWPNLEGHCSTSTCSHAPILCNHELVYHCWMRQSERIGSIVSSNSVIKFVLHIHYNVTYNGHKHITSETKL
jgi:hypothetical protein